MLCNLHIWGHYIMLCNLTFGGITSCCVTYTIEGIKSRHIAENCKSLMSFIVQWNLKNEDFLLQNKVNFTFFTAEFQDIISFFHEVDCDELPNKVYFTFFTAEFQDIILSNFQIRYTLLSAEQNFKTLYFQTSK